MRAKRMAVGAALGCVLLGGAMAGCASGSDGGSGGERGGRDLGRGQESSWDEKATPASVSKQMGVAIPAGATDSRAAYRHGFQDDGLLLTFTLPTADVDAFVATLRPEEELFTRAAPRKKVATPMTPFSRLGLPEPETLGDVREGQVCAPCGGELNALTVAVHRLDGGDSSRVYLRAVD
ncbi:hypothetical protein ACFVZW_04565 [Streptomyces sp. NPDC059567]|uniref:hypothetical protein n=1 Tax=Streptomyces sp. NPDC059567 TaxID=3346867 RepID=UPI0036CD75DD